VDRNVWDPKTPPGFTDIQTPNAMAVELCVYFYEHSARTEADARAHVERASQIWCQVGINIQCIHLQRLPRITASEPLDLTSPTVSDLISCGKLSDLERDQLFAVGRPGCPGSPNRCIAVYYIPGARLAGGFATGCHQFRVQGADGRPEHLILLTDSAVPRVLAHEIGHALFTHKQGTTWINHDPGPGTNPSDRSHNLNPSNLMHPNVPNNPEITPRQAALARSCLLTLREDLTSGFRDGSPVKLGFRWKQIHVFEEDDEIGSDNLLESQWHFRVQSTKSPVFNELRGFNESALGIGIRPLPSTLDFHPILMRGNDDTIKLTVRGIDEDSASHHDTFPVIEKTIVKGNDLWGTTSKSGDDATSIGEHTLGRFHSDDIDYSITYHIRLILDAHDHIFRTICPPQ
jgi:hypothetical protein